MPDINDVLAANRAAVLDLVAAAERATATWTTPRAPGKWSPSQVVEHIARGLDETANILSGAPSIPMPPALLRLLSARFTLATITDRCQARPKRLPGSKARKCHVPHRIRTSW
jgi:hypothetical protein